MPPVSSAVDLEGTPSVRACWQPPVFRELALGAPQGRADKAPRDRPAAAAPEAPAEPALKLGFSFEASLPLAARTTI